MKFALALLIAVHFWGDRNVHVPCHPVAVLGQDALLPRDLYGFPAPMATEGCQVWMSRSGAADATNWPPMFCAEVVHEVGHVAGLGHTPTGIMSPALVYTDAPYDCVHWRRFVRGLHSGAVNLGGPGGY